MADKIKDNEFNGEFNRETRGSLNKSSSLKSGRIIKGTIIANDKAQIPVERLVSS